MRSILLSVQGVKVKELNGKYQLLDSFSDNGADLHEVLQRFLKLQEGMPYVVKETQQAFEVKEVHSQKRQIDGILEGGHFGTQSNIRNLDKWSEVAYKKKVRDVDPNPFYFLFDLPEGRELGFLLVQSMGTEGVQTSLAQMLHEQFIKEYPDDRIRYHRIVPEDLRKELATAPLSEITFIRHSIPRDLATVIGRKASKQTKGTMRLTMRLDEDGAVASESVRAFFEKRRGTETVLELEGVEFPYDSVKIKVKVNGKEHTMDLANPDRLRASFDITDEIERANTGHPTFASISRVAKEKLDSIKTVLYGGPHVPG